MNKLLLNERKDD